VLLARKTVVRENENSGTVGGVGGLSVSVVVGVGVDVIDVF
jgi:hypothetical protein